MKRSKPLRVTAGLAWLAVTVMTLMVGATTQSMPGHNMASMSTQSDMGMAGSLTALQGEEFETAFMSAMIAHHQSATEMAQWILERTEDPEITGAAQGIIDEQEAEIAQMTGWLQEWYGQEPDAEMMGMMQEMMAGMMQTMMDAGDPERAFLEGMSMHHDSAIDMAQLALFRSVHPELRTLAGNIIMAQVKEVVRFQGWLTEQ